MTDMQPNLGALIATSVTAQAFGAACAVVFLAYHHIPEGNGVDSKMLEDALTVIFSTASSVLAMIGHYLVVKCLIPKT
jgi:hypothetical protein